MRIAGDVYSAQNPEQYPKRAGQYPEGNERYQRGDEKDDEKENKIHHARTLEHS